jgi:hypothetical protein
VTKLKEELASPLRVMQEQARRIAKVAKEAKLPLDEEQYVQSFKVELMDAVVQWCRGASFTEICKARPDRFTLFSLILVLTGSLAVAHGPVRRQSHSCLQAIARAHQADDASCQGHREHGAAREV